MAEKSYLTNHDAIKSYTDLNHVDLNVHGHIWKNIIDSHPFNQAVSLMWNNTHLLLILIIAFCIFTDLFD